MSTSEKIGLDPKRLALLTRVGGGALVRQMMDLFLENAPRRLEEARLAFEGADLPAVGRAVHSLKSSAGNLGASEMLGIAARIEQLSTEGNASAVAPLLSELHAAFGRAKEAIEEERKGLAE